jgi:membrane-associated phospholipid phosphatase
MPSDVLGGYLVASCWAALAVAALRLAERRWPTGKAL